MTEAPPKVVYLAQKLRSLHDEVTATQNAYQAAADEWAASLCDYKVDDLVVVRGVPTWSAKVTNVRACRFQEPEEHPIVMVEVRYVRKDGQFGFRSATFHGSGKSEGFFCTHNNFRLERQSTNSLER